MNERTDGHRKGTNNNNNSARTNQTEWIATQDQQRVQDFEDSHDVQTLWIAFSMALIAVITRVCVGAHKLIKLRFGRLEMNSSI